jgi:transposase InsO family protein
MDASFCVDCLEDALRAHGKPEVFNSDQGSQFTSHAFTDGVGRWTIFSSSGYGASSSTRTCT